MMVTIIAALVPVLVPAFGTLLTGLVSWTLLEAKKYIGTKTKNELVNNAMERITHTVETTVAALSQTIAISIKEKADDGKLTANESQIIKLQALDAVRRQLPDSIKEDVKLGANDLEALIMSKIEQAVLKQKSIEPVTLLSLSTEDMPVNDKEMPVELLPTSKDNIQIIDQVPAVDENMDAQHAIEDVAKRLFDLIQQSKSKP